MAVPSVSRWLTGLSLSAIWSRSSVWTGPSLSPRRWAEVTPCPLSSALTLLISQLWLPWRLFSRQSSPDSSTKASWYVVRMLELIYWLIRQIVNTPSRLICGTQISRSEALLFWLHGKVEIWECCSLDGIYHEKKEIEILFRPAPLKRTKTYKNYGSKLLISNLNKRNKADEFHRIAMLTKIRILNIVESL